MSKAVYINKVITITFNMCQDVAFLIEQNLRRSRSYGECFVIEKKIQIGAEWA